MASVITFGVGDKFIITIRKSLVEQPLVRWVNRYELLAVGDGDLDDLIEALSRFTAFEQNMHFNTVHFDQAEVATWKPDSQPYNPEAFYTQQLDLTGFTAPQADLLDLVVCGLVRRQALSGRNGVLALRGCLDETDVLSTGGVWRFSVTGLARWGVNLASAINNILMYMNGSSPVLRFVMIDAEGTHIRAVLDMVIGKISNVKRDHRYFDRPTAPATAARVRSMARPQPSVSIQEQLKVADRISKRK